MRGAVTRMAARAGLVALAPVKWGLSLALGLLVNVRAAWAAGEERRARKRHERAKEEASRVANGWRPR